jgi:tripartite-type tricarboxylate transporter receptor subunit TctC
LFACRITKQFAPLLGILAVALPLSAACTSQCVASSPAGYFRGKTVHVIVSYAAGGGYDLNARVVAEFLRHHLPGSPATVVENMAGAGGLIAANYLAHQAAADGLTIGLLGASAVIPQVLDQPGVQYDVRRFNVIGALTSEKDYVCISRREGGIDLEKWRSREGGGLLGTPGRGASGHVQAAFLAAALQLPVRFVTGYRGTAEVRLALDAGEVDIMCSQLATYRNTVEPTGRYSPILQSGEQPQLLEQGVPSAARLVRDARGRALLELREAVIITDRFYVAPPDTPAPLVAQLRRAFDETMKDDAFLAAARGARLDTEAVSADDVTRRLSALFDLPADQRQTVKNLISAESLP